jgi:hypothetical protein
MSSRQKPTKDGHPVWSVLREADCHFERNQLTCCKTLHSASDDDGLLERPRQRTNVDNIKIDWIKVSLESSVMGSQ